MGGGVHGGVSGSVGPLRGDADRRRYHRFEGCIAICVTALGRAPLGHIKRRSAAQEGDAVAVSGRLGLAAAGLEDILADRTGTAAARAHNDPTPQVDEGEWLGSRAEVHAMMDLSDGLASDLCHILRASGCGAEVEVERIPAEGSMRQAVAGGEDYRLLLTVAAGAFERLSHDFERRFARPLYPVGRITRGSELVWKRRGRVFRPAWKGYTHFKGMLLSMAALLNGIC